ncbi:LysE family translocator [Corallococcus sp. CA053C]|uniref:LysE family translocator n=1 Tax=Corallococcus sp. CA053C TaxID=2316732 RepID=UPI000EA2E731|nr:LysE family translocator [Corallococcus sp. CA053C]RKH04833.1 LysE family translocator [Corallococcus sp. CA053C]
MNVALSMAAFALAASITPGPVNLVTLSTGARFGLRAALRYVTGATVGFTLLLVLLGLGLYEVLDHWPFLTEALRLAGVAFILFMAWRLAVDDGALSEAKTGVAPTFLQGATLQWLNPKAWLASVAGMGAFAANGEPERVWRFAAVYFGVCLGSMACWAWAGTALRGSLGNPSRVRLFNRGMAALLIGCALSLLLS